SICTPVASSICKPGPFRLRWKLRRTAIALAKAVGPGEQSATCCLLIVVGLHLFRMQQDLLHAPRGDLGDVQLVWISEVHLVTAAEFLQRFPRLAEPAKHLAVQLHLVYLARSLGLTPVAAA